MVVNFEMQQREKIRQEELEFLRQQALVDETRAQVQQQRLEERAWHQQQVRLAYLPARTRPCSLACRHLTHGTHGVVGEQALLQEAEDARRARAQDEDRRLLEQRQKIEVLKRQQLAQQIQVRRCPPATPAPGQVGEDKRREGLTLLPPLPPPAGWSPGAPGVAGGFSRAASKAAR